MRRSTLLSLPLIEYSLVKASGLNGYVTRGCIFSHVQPSYEWAVSDQDKSMHISLWV